MLYYAEAIIMQKFNEFKDIPPAELLLLSPPDNEVTCTDGNISQTSHTI